ncbi:MAG: hypothetical protein AAF985_14030 [Bacteroidota bacterium]
MIATAFNIDFDFTSATQKKILQHLQNNGYKLMGYKGAKGAGQVTAGLPTWFAIPYMDMFAKVDINYEPLYKVYVSQQSEIGPNTTLNVSAMSKEFPLGTSLAFNPDGSFSIDTTNPAPAGTISLLNNRPSSTPKVTVGLAAKVNGNFSPFCAFTLTPQGSVNMEPLEKVCLFAAQTSLQSGSVVGQAAAPGCTFEFSESAIDYSLEMIPNTYGIQAAPGGIPVAEISSGASLTQLLNS